MNASLLSETTAPGFPRVAPEPGAAQAASATTTAPTLQMDIDGKAIAYRVVGSAGGVPLLLLNRFRGTMDHWDPALIDRIATKRKVIMFDQPGFARSAGEPADSPAAFAAMAARVARRLGHPQVE